MIQSRRSFVEMNLVNLGMILDGSIGTFSSSEFVTVASGNFMTPKLTTIALT